MIEFRRFTVAGTDALAEFLSAEEWPFHAVPRVDPEDVRRRAADGYYDGPSARTFWIIADGSTVGMVRLFDLDDGAPLFDVRLRSASRRRGIGSQAVAWLTAYLFTELPEINRIEATTRHDNHAMRHILRTHGYAKEAHYRQSWPAPDGTLHDTVAYAILRHDWQTGTVTQPNFADEPPS
jgi:RimJ/RimL family protein N-acetyltransferase